MITMSIAPLLFAGLFFSSVSGSGCGWKVATPSYLQAIKAKRVIDADEGEYVEHVDLVFTFEEHAHRLLSEGHSPAEIFEGQETWYGANKASCTNVPTDAAFKLPAAWLEVEDGHDCIRFEVNPNTASSQLGINIQSTTWDGEAFYQAFPVEDHRRRALGGLRVLSGDHNACEVVDIVSQTTGLPSKVIGTWKNDAYTLGRPGESATLIGTKTEASWEPWVAGLIVNITTLVGIIFMLPLIKAAVVPKAPNDLEMTGNGGDAGAKGTSMPQAGATATVENPEAGVIIAQKAMYEEGELPVDLEEEALSTVFSPQIICYTSAFASGAILSTAFLLIIPEALHLIEDGGEFGDEAAVFWRWGAWLLFGFLTPYIIGVAIAALCYSRGNYDTVRVATGVLVGDAFHNFTDGIFMAAAFTSCSPSFGWTVMVSTVAHEITQEIADFFILVTVCNFPPVKALACNFLSGAAIFIGILVVIVGNISDLWTGYLLVYGGGIYIYVGGNECFNRIVRLAKTPKEKCIAFLLFAVAAVCLGLVLLDHQHCEVTVNGIDPHNH